MFTVESLHSAVCSYLFMFPVLYCRAYVDEPFIVCPDIVIYQCSFLFADESLEASCRSLLQEHAVEVGLDMFGLLVARVNDLLISHLATTSSDSSPHQPLSDDLQQLLPGVKVWVDWMMCHSSLWNPQPSLRPPDIGSVVFTPLSD